MEFSVIVVDDDEVDRYIVQRVIKSFNAEVKVLEYAAGDSFVDTVLDEAKREVAFGEMKPPILVLLDINMPRMNGFEVLSTLKDELASLNQLLIFTMYSSSSHAEDRNDAMRFEFVSDYIVKPLTLEKLEDIVARHVVAG
ncbi:MAG: response regulator [Burkholderiaceae bacterium]